MAEKKIELDIESAKSSYAFISAQISRAELGLRAICQMYLDETGGKIPANDIYILKQSIYFRSLTSLTQYKFLFETIDRHTQYIRREIKNDDQAITKLSFRFSIEATSVIDNVIFNITSAFDYLAHYISYFLVKNKSKTFYWTQLIKYVNDEKNQVDHDIKNTIRAVDNTLTRRLYDFRSDLIHNKLTHYRLSLRLNASNDSIKILSYIPDNLKRKFKTILKNDSQAQITTAFFIESIYRSFFKSIEQILDAFYQYFQKHSQYVENMQSGKKLLLVYLDPNTNMAKPMYKILWSAYKSNSNLL